MITRIMAFLILSLILFQPLQAAPAGLNTGRRAIPASKPHRPDTALAGDLTHLRRGVLRYLEQGFCRDGLCSAGAWTQWIIAGDGGDWTIGQLNMVRHALLNTMSALDAAGLDGAHLLDGYRLRRENGRYVNGQRGRLAEVNHQTRLISLTAGAFLDYGAFVIHHELGHVVDRQLGRALTAAFEDSALLGTASGNNDVLVNGYWLRQQTHTSASEAAADAFAIWVLVRHNGYAPPDFPSMPDTVDLPLIFTLVEATLR